jgi:amidase
LIFEALQGLRACLLTWTAYEYRFEKISATSPPSWESRALEKRTNVLSPLPPEYLHPNLTHSITDPSSAQDIPNQLLTPTEQTITTLPSSLSTGQYTSVQVLQAFTHRAAIAHQLLNCCLEFPYISPLTKAQNLDKYYRESGGKTAGPLHGLPISVKDQVRVKGTEATCGFVANMGKMDERDSLMIEILERAGAVVFVKTGLSMGCMWGETVNKLVFSGWDGSRE